VSPSLPDLNTHAGRQTEFGEAQKEHVARHCRRRNARREARMDQQAHSPPARIKPPGESSSCAASSTPTTARESDDTRPVAAAAAETWASPATHMRRTRARDCCSRRGSRPSPRLARWRPRRRRPAPVFASGPASASPPGPSAPRARIHSSQLKPAARRRMSAEGCGCAADARPRVGFRRRGAF
jgi:hypothetical protein